MSDQGQPPEGEDPADLLPEPDLKRDGVEEIQDPNEYALRRRLGQILDARERVVLARREAREKFHGVRHNGVRENRQAGHVAHAVHQYAVEVEPLVLGQRDEIEVEWPEEALWEDLESYIEMMGFVDCEAPVATYSSSRKSGKSSLVPPKPSHSILVYRYLNRVLADIGLDVNRADDKPFNRY